MTAQEEKALAEDLNLIRGIHLAWSPERIESQLLVALRNEVSIMRTAYDEVVGVGLSCGFDPFWLREGYRAVTAAWEFELALAKFRRACTKAVIVKRVFLHDHYVWDVFVGEPRNSTGVERNTSHVACPEADAIVSAVGFGRESA